MSCLKRYILLDQLRNMIKMMNRTIGDNSSFYKLSFESKTVGQRGRAIRWIKQVAKAFQISPHARDSGIQIFDKFLASTLSEKQECKVDEDFISYSAAVSIILGSKLHESRRDLTMASFQDFQIYALKNCERLILNKIGFAIAPQVTPYAFISNFLLIWQPTKDNTKLEDIAENLVSDFWEEPSSLLFAPSTIAIAALILSFSILRMDCTDWLRCIPNFCLPLTDNPLSNQDTNMRLFDIDGCLQSFKGVEANYSKKAVTENKIGLSPTSVVDSLLLADSLPCSPSTSPSPPITPSELRKRTRSLPNLNEDKTADTVPGPTDKIATKRTKRIDTSTSFTTRKRSLSLSTLSERKPIVIISRSADGPAGDLEMKRIKLHNFRPIKNSNLFLKIPRLDFSHLLTDFLSNKMSVSV